MATTAPSPIVDVAIGTIFGAALTAAGVFSPAVITSQFRLENFHMMETFMAASAASALAIAISNHLSHTNTPPRTPSPHIRLLTRYDANVLGGALQGLGMSLSGACPGTVLVQLAAGVPAGRFVLLGCLAGGVSFPLLAPTLFPLGKAGSEQEEKPKKDEVTGKPAEPQPAAQAPGWLPVLVYEGLMVSALSALVQLAPVTKPTFLPPPVGGLVIGAGQVASLALARRTLGVSTAYRQAGEWVVATFAPADAGRKRPESLSSVRFAAGVVVGASLLRAVWPEAVEMALNAGRGAEPGPLRAAVGGVALAWGAMTAGGCTSGHGLSGMATLGTASFVTVAAMFGAGIAFGTLFG